MEEIFNKIITDYCDVKARGAIPAYFSGIFNNSGINHTEFILGSRKNRNWEMWDSLKAKMNEETKRAVISGFGGILQELVIFTEYRFYSRFSQPLPNEHYKGLLKQAMIRNADIKYAKKAEDVLNRKKANKTDDESEY